MIVSVNPHPPLNDFQRLMAHTDRILNEDALKRPKYYASRGGNPLEDDVEAALIESAKGTPFENTIEKISGQRFPDIIAAKFYGVEVKSTKDDHWTSTGSSILETTRVSGIERIYMTFGKLGGNPVQFLSKPYEQCLYGIAVTHMPRYLIDMRLGEGETIFDKMGVSYDALRKMDNPIAPVAKYYRSQLKPGESLWWADTENVADESAPPTVRLWTALPSDMKEILTVQGYALFPEVLRSGSPKKYNRYALWLVTKKGVVNTNIRDSFSAGGKVPMRTTEGIDVMMPAAFGRIKKYHELIEELLEEISEETLKEYWETDVIDEDRLTQWCRMVSSAATTDPNIDYSLAWKVLTGIFPGLGKKRGNLGEKKKIYVYNKQDGSTLKVAEERTPYGEARPKVIETPFASIQVGDRVSHKTFGNGIVNEINNGKIVINFSDGEKRFEYPSALQKGFLKKI